MLPLPTRINLGSGKDWRPDWLNLDHDPFWQPDVVLDCNRPFAPFGPVHTERFGTVTLAENAFTEILAQDVLEHLTGLVPAMTSCLALLAPGGVMRVKVPYDLSHGAWQDPTHVRAFNEHSFSYFTNAFWYLGWTEARFDLQEMRFGIGPVGKELAARGLSPDEVLRQPRAIEHLDVVLRKRLLNAEEKARVLAFRAPRG